MYVRVSVHASFFHFRGKCRYLPDKDCNTAEDGVEVVEVVVSTIGGVDCMLCNVFMLKAGMVMVWSPVYHALQRAS